MQKKVRSAESAAASLLRTDHLLGGSESNTFFQVLSLAIEEANKEMALDKG